MGIPRADSGRKDSTDCSVIGVSSIIGVGRHWADEQPGIAHRLNRDTFGCLVVGRHKAALRQLAKLLGRGAVERTDWAIVHGLPASDAGTNDRPLRKRSLVHGWWMEPHPDDQSAITEWRVMGRGPQLAWIECRPRTGRTHQIRVHLAHLGHAIFGDPIYGPKEGPRPPMHLHALGVAFEYLAERRGNVTAEPPSTMRGTLAGFARLLGTRA